MKNILTILCLLLLSQAMSNPPKNISTVKTKIEPLLKESTGTFAIAFKDLQSSQTYYLRENESFHAASTMKTPVMVELFRQVQRGTLSLNDSIEIKNSFRSIVDGSEYSLDLGDDSDDGLYSSLGKKETVRLLVVKMITVSSNLATNILIEKVGAANVMKTMRAMGLKNINVLRGVEDSKAFEAGLNNTTTAYDLMVLFEAIANKSVITEQACTEMVDILLAQAFKDMIPGQLPKDVRVAHKTGSITNIQHDSGIIYLPDGRKYVLVILSKNLPSNAEGIRIISQLSKMFYDYMME